MAKRILNVVECAYRATLEEQDDTILWLTQAMRGGGAAVAVLLCGSAVGYALRDQDASGLVFGSRPQTRPPRPADDLARLVGSGVPVYYVAADAADRGIEPADLTPGITAVDRARLPVLFVEYDHVFRW